MIYMFDSPEPFMEIEGVPVHVNWMYTGFAQIQVFLGGEVRIRVSPWMLDNLSDDELEAILWHEQGHYVLGHCTDDAGWPKWFPRRLRRFKFLQMHYQRKLEFQADQCVPVHLRQAFASGMMLIEEKGIVVERKSVIKKLIGGSHPPTLARINRLLR